MFDQIETTILSALQTIFDQFGWAGVFGLMVFENATGITPSEIILAFAGWMLIERHGIAPTFVLIAGVYAGLGSTLGASITYWIARLGGRPVIDRFARFFRIDPALINKAEEQMQKMGFRIGIDRQNHPRNSHAHQHPGRVGENPISEILRSNFYRCLYLVYTSHRRGLCPWPRMDAGQ